jgi:hypothetical protein
VISQDVCQGPAPERRVPGRIEGEGCPLPGHVHMPEPEPAPLVDTCGHAQSPLEAVLLRPVVNALNQLIALLLMSREPRTQVEQLLLTTVCFYEQVVDGIGP